MVLTAPHSCPMKNLHNITLYTQGTVTQTIRLNDGVDMSTETLGDEIQNGNILTSIGHGENNGRVYFLGDGDFKEIGKVVAQEAHGDFEISIWEEEPLMDEVYISGVDLSEKTDHDA